jgi:hypothetical protein
MTPPSRGHPKQTIRNLGRVTRHPHPELVAQLKAMTSDELSEWCARCLESKEMPSAKLNQLLAKLQHMAELEDYALEFDHPPLPESLRSVG